MATAKLKERMDHVMNYPALKAHAVSPRRVTVMAAAALVLFTVAAGIVGSDRALAATKEGPYALRFTATRSGTAVLVQGTVSDNSTHEVIASPKMKFESGMPASMTKSDGGIDVRLDARPNGDGRIAVDVTIDKDGQLVQRDTIIVTPTEAEQPKYSGEPISLDLESADLRNVLNTFGKVTGFEMRIDESVQGKVSVHWHNVPWDEAFDSLIKENGLSYKIEGKAIHVSRNLS